MADMIDLGQPFPKAETAAKFNDTKKKSFPTMHVHGIKALDSLPEGHFHFMAKGKVVHRSATQRAGQPESVSHEIEVHSMKPMGKGEPKGGLDGAMKKIEKKKTGALPSDDDGDEPGD